MRGPPEDAVRVPCQIFDRVHGTVEAEAFDAGLEEVKSTGSGGRSAISSELFGDHHDGWEYDGRNWNPREKEDTLQEKHAAQPTDELSAHVPETSAPEGSPARVSPGEETLSEGHPSEEDEEEDEDKGPEAKTPELDEYCRFCACSRTETRDKCDQCGVAFIDRLRPWEETDRDRTTLKVDMRQMFSEDEPSPTLQPLTIDPESGCPEPLALNMAWKDETDPEWTRLRTVMDSGAAESVGPPSMAPGVPIHESPGSRRGQAYIAAGHERIPNMGQQVLSVVTNEGHEAQALYQIAEVTRPLTAVGSTCDRGNVVIYGPHGGCILNLESGVQTDFTRRGGIYELDLWMRTTPSGEDYQRDFPRLGR